MHPKSLNYFEYGKRRKKYVLTDETMEWNGHTLHKIVSLIKFVCCDRYIINVGDEGGWVESQKNLSQDGRCWVFGDAKVYGDAIVKDNAMICNNAEVYDYAVVSDNATVLCDAKIHGHSYISDDAIVDDNAEIYGNGIIVGIGSVNDNAKVYGRGRVAGTLYDDVIVCENGNVVEDATIIGNAIISSRKDYFIFINTFSESIFIIWTRSNNKWKVGWFYGNDEMLLKMAKKDGHKTYEGYKAYVDLKNKILEVEKMEVEKMEEKLGI